MSGRGQRTVLRLGGASAEVVLLKSSGKPREAQHEVRRTVAPELSEGMTRELPGDDPGMVRLPPVDALGAGEASREGLKAQAADHFAPLDETHHHGPETVASYADLPPAGPNVETRTTAPVEHGVTTEQGEWVNLTESLAEIDARTKLDGIELAATVSSLDVPRERVRDAHYLAPAGEGAPKVLALLWQALRSQGAVGLVRWTKRTNQALGAIVARGQGADRHLVLLELEWSANMRKVPTRANLLPAFAGVTVHEEEAARKLVEAYREKPVVFESLRDERSGQRADLLEAARAGRKYAPPVEQETPAEASEFGVVLAAVA